MKKRTFFSTTIAALACFVALVSCSSPVSTLANSTSSARAIGTFSTADYATVFKDAIYFYDANKCGPDAGVDQYFAWRAACHDEDGADVGLDLDGGFHDAGDHVKFGLPQGYAAATLGWGLYEFNSAYDKAGIKTKMLSTMKYFTDYFLKSHPNATTFYYQVGNGDQDHQYWGSPELQSKVRPTRFVANASNPASDVLGVHSAALSLMYLNYKSVDATYANRCLQAAKELYVMGKSNQGKGQEESYYLSHSFYDDLSWAATWLYIITKDNAYLTDIDSYLSHNTEFGSSPYEDKWTMCWDDTYLAVFTKLAEVTGQAKYKTAVEFNIDYWMNSLTKTPGGLRYLDGWGALRYAMAESMIAMLYYKQTTNVKYRDFALSQVDYVMGKNPRNSSYVIGFGNNYPKIPHHRAANGYQGYNDNHNNLPALHVLTGGLVGGPDQTDGYNESNGDYKYTEVALDYNAGFVGVMAGVVAYSDGTIPSPSPSPSTAPTPSPSVIPTPSTNPTPSPTPPSETPYSGTPIALPGTIEAENFDNGGEGVAFHDADAANNGGAYRSTAVDLENCTEGGYNVGWTASGEYLKYMVNVSSGGSFRIDARVASLPGNRPFHVEIDDVSVASFTVPATGAWQTFTTLSSNSVTIPSGNHIVKIVFDSDQINVNWVKINLIGTPLPTPTPSPSPSPSPSPVPTPSPSPSPSPVVSPSPQPGNLVVTYTKNDWGSGFTGNIVIANNGDTAVSNWTLKFSFAGNQTITQFWSSTIVQSGKNVTVTPASYNSTIPAHASINLGFNANYSGSNVDPATFSVTY